MTTITRALISVSDKTGIVEFARDLAEAGVEILSTGGTAKLLRDNGIPVIEVCDYTGFPEMMDGRVKTLHPKVHGGILGRRGTDDEVMERHGIGRIDLVVVNLYPFEQAVADPDCSLDNAIENIDIGGPTMMRAAAKNHRDVAVVVDPHDYGRVIQEMRSNNGAVSAATCFRLAVKTFEHTAQYDGAIANYLGAIDADGSKRDFPRHHQPAVPPGADHALRREPAPEGRLLSSKQDIQEASVATARQLQGKELSYNNIGDTDAALECVKQFSEGPACVIVKHANPCGVAFGGDLLEAYDRAYSTDPESAFGGIIAFNGELDGADRAGHRRPPVRRGHHRPDRLGRGHRGGQGKEERAPAGLRRVGRRGYPPARLQAGQRRPAGAGCRPAAAQRHPGGDRAHAHRGRRCATCCSPGGSPNSSNPMPSSTARDGMTIGVGAGQMSRINSARIAGIKAEHAGLEVPGSVMASDAFFPFRDGLDSAAEAGITAVIQPGGSMRDEEVIAAANEHGMAMVFTGMRHFRH